MGSILNPDKDNSFIRLVKFKDSEIFIDKTDFIEKMSAKINSQNCLFAVTRPRRFGKTVTAHMLSAYYSKGYAGQKIFDNLKITNNEFKDSYEKHLNKYNVIYIDMNTIDGLFDGYSNKKQKVDGVNDLVDYFEYSIIKELKSSSEFAGCLEKHQIENTGLLETLLAITQ
ncbi:AAA family ATPase, partial [Ruminobacter sp. RM87]|uniref:AAA family ATPase n=1 Tax=Ruminobacter sp. RM87 TaxID=1200567 RepID=UPI0004E16175